MAEINSSELNEVSGGAYYGTPTRFDTYTVQSGDCLSTIAEKFGFGGNYMILFEYNRDRIQDPRLIYPGQVLLIPRFN